MALHAALSLLALFALVLTAVVCDLRSRRIPNALVASGIALGLLFQAVAPDAGGGLFGHRAGALGVVPALLGGLLGLGLFLPLYALRAMGAGDVKLLAMVGVWLGAPAVAYAALWTLLAGGVLALGWALGTGVLRRVLANLREMAVSSFVRIQAGGGAAVPAPPTPTGRLPYAVAIACGTALEVLLLRSGLHG
jgi:prepilin peptidase CpaA